MATKERKTGEELVALFENATKNCTLQFQYDPISHGDRMEICKEAKKELLNYIQKLEEFYKNSPAQVGL